MAVKKKASVKKVAKKAPAKKKAAVKKVAKKAPAKKAPAKKAPAKKAPAKKKAAAKKVVKKTAKKATSASKFVVPPVPVGGVKSPSRANITTMPTPTKSAPASKSSSVSKPSAAPKQGTSPRVLMAAIIAIALLAVVVITRPASDSDDMDAPEMPVATESAAPAPTEAAPTESAPTEAVAAVEAPTRFIGNWKDSSKSVMVITWKAPTATAGLTGYKFEVRSGMGPWTESGILPADQLSIEFTKASMDGSTSFRISSVYSDGQTASAKAFGFSGQFL